jgi:hypothetical protein
MLPEEQLKRALKLFKFKFNPIKSLFATSVSEQVKKPFPKFNDHFGNSQFENENQEGMIDLFEDNMLEEVESSGVLDLKDPV